MPIQKEWSQFNQEEVEAVPVAQGVYELGDADGQIVYIGFTERAEDLKGLLTCHLQANLENIKLFRVLPSAFLQHPELMAQKQCEMFKAEHGEEPKLQNSLTKG